MSRYSYCTTVLEILHVSIANFCDVCTVLPEEGARSNPHLMLVTTRRGGHIGFMEGLMPFRKNLMDRALIQFSTAVFEHNAFV